MTVLNQAAPAEKETDIEFLLEQLAALEAVTVGDDTAEGCNGCRQCSA